MTRNEARIGQTVVTASQPYIVYSPVRGLISEHRTLGAARRALERARKDCSDAEIYYFDWRWHCIE